MVQCCIQCAFINWGFSTAIRKSRLRDYFHFSRKNRPECVVRKNIPKRVVRKNRPGYVIRKNRPECVIRKNRLECVVRKNRPECVVRKNIPGCVGHTNSHCLAETAFADQMGIGKTIFHENTRPRNFQNREINSR